MAAIATTTANKTLDHLNAVTALTLPTSPLKLKLFTTTGTAGATGTEVSGGSYASQTITMGAAASGSAANTNAITFTNMPVCTVTGFEIYDTAGTPLRVWFGNVTTSKTYAAGDNATIAIGAITTALS